MREVVGGWVHLRRRLVGVALVVAACLSAPVGPAGAQLSPDEIRSSAGDLAAARVTDALRAPEPVIADFEGRRIDLASGWAQAQACMVLDKGKVECFRSGAAMDGRATTIESQYAAASFSCSSPLRLYEHSAYGGRQLMFYSRGYWQNLPDYGFNDYLSSYQIGACPAYLADHITGGGAWYPGPTAAYSSVPWMISSWNDRVSSIYIS